MSAKTAKINYNNILDCTSIRHHLASQVPAHKGVSYDEDHRIPNNNNNNTKGGANSNQTHLGLPGSSPEGGTFWRKQPSSPGRAGQASWVASFSFLFL